MATERQIAANRLNAPRGGPKTPEGKAAVGRNAVTHGLTSYSGLLPGEKLDDFSDLRDRILAELAPGSAIEIELTERVAKSPVAAAARSSLRGSPPRLDECLQRGGEHYDAERATSHQLARARPAPSRRRTRHPCLWALARWFPEGGVGGRLSRYENALQRALAASMLELLAYAGAAESANRARCLRGSRTRGRRRHATARVHGARRAHR